MGATSTHLKRLECILTHLPPSDAVRKQKKNILEDLHSSISSQFRDYHPSGNAKFNNLDIFQSLKLRILIEKILPISLEINFTRNTLGCYGLSSSHLSVTFKSKSDNF